MNIISLSPTSFATRVWNYVTRGLTTYVNASCITFTSFFGQVIAASASLDIRPAAGSIIIITFECVAGPAGACDCYLTNGTSVFDIVHIIPTSRTTVLNLMVTSNTWLRIINSDAANGVSLSYSYSTLT